MPEVSFLSKSTRFRLSKPRKVSLWLQAVARREGKRIDTLTYVFATDTLVTRLNRRYLGHDTLTDIITFDYSEESELSGDVFISIPRVRENARIYRQPFETELRRVIVHGLLHLLGYKDKTERQSAQMRRKEEACLSLWV